MNVPRELVEAAVAALNKAFDYEGDVFGVMHNDAVDVLIALEGLLIDTPEELL